MICGTRNSKDDGAYLQTMLIALVSEKKTADKIFETLEDTCEKAFPRLTILE